MAAQDCRHTSGTLEMAMAKRRPAEPVVIPMTFEDAVQHILKASPAPKSSPTTKRVKKTKKKR